MPALDTVLTQGQRRLQAKAHFKRLVPVARHLRERAGLHQSEIAKLCDVAESEVCRWESGKRTPRAGTLEKYVQILVKLAQGDAHV